MKGNTCFNLLFRNSQKWQLQLLLLLLIPLSQFANSTQLDSLETRLTTHPRDTAALSMYIYSIINARGKDMALAEEIGKKAIKFAKKSGAQLHLSNAYNMAAITLSQLEKTDEAMELYQKAITILKEQNSRDELSKIYVNIGSLYLQSKNHLQAEPWLLKAKKNMGTKTYDPVLNNNLALIYSHKGEYPKAIKIYQELLDQPDSLKSLRSEALAHNNMGYTFQQMNQHRTALSHYRKANQIISQTTYNLEKGYLLMSLIDGLVHNKLYLEANQMLDSLQVIARASNAPNQISEMHRTLAGVYQEQGKDKEALNQYVLYMTMNDSLQKEDQNMKIAELQSKLEVAERDAEIEMMARENELEVAKSNQQRYYIWIMAGGLLILGIVLVLLIINM
ncbi:MAG TPA: tetratricopeptide repeat protein, partial [Bacteroidetes bacterium]|nr:tetratricopeptide repeat protein [Bacteroidota bacterium]